MVAKVVVLVESDILVASLTEVNVSDGWDEGTDTICVATPDKLWIEVVTTPLVVAIGVGGCGIFVANEDKLCFPKFCICLNLLSASSIGGLLS